MTDEAALRAAVIAHPDDDTPRLVYADWLDDNAGTVTCDWCGGSGEDRRPGPFRADGKVYEYRGPLGPCPKCKGACSLPDGLAARAAFIRAQVALAREPATLPPGQVVYSPGGIAIGLTMTETPNPKAQELKKQVAELFRQSDETRGWFGPAFALTVAGIRWDAYLEWFSRGFVERVRCYASEWELHGDDILAALPVRHVAMTTRPTFPQYLFDEAHRRFHVEVAGKQVCVPEVDVAMAMSSEGVVRRVLQARWPGIEFTLPPERPEPDYATFMREMQNEIIRGVMGYPARVVDPRAFIRPTV